MICFTISLTAPIDPVFSRNLGKFRVISRLTGSSQIPSLRPPRDRKHGRNHLLTST